MRHGFWPRCQAEGSIITKAGEVNFNGRAFFVHALQGMKPHHAGKEVIALFLDFPSLMTCQPPSGILSISSPRLTPLL